MARKKASKKKISHRRRRVSGVALNAKSPLVQIGAIAAGYFIGDKLNEKILEKAGTVDPKIIAAVEAVGGFLIRSKMKGAAGAILGGALMGAGAKLALKEFGVINGVPTIAGYRDLRTINGLPAPVRRVAGPVAPGISNSLSVINGIGDSSYMDTDR